eukprot:4786278-Lingulodinium_polyedra.AAC.1
MTSRTPRPRVSTKRRWPRQRTASWTSPRRLTGRCARAAAHGRGASSGSPPTRPAARADPWLDRQRGHGEPSCAWAA